MAKIVIDRWTGLPKKKKKRTPIWAQLLRTAVWLDNKPYYPFTRLSNAMENSSVIMVLGIVLTLIMLSAPAAFLMMARAIPFYIVFPIFVIAELYAIGAFMKMFMSFEDFVWMKIDRHPDDDEPVTYIDLACAWEAKTGKLSREVHDLLYDSYTRTAEEYLFSPEGSFGANARSLLTFGKQTDGAISREEANRRLKECSDSERRSFLGEVNESWESIVEDVANLVTIWQSELHMFRAVAVNPSKEAQVSAMWKVGESLGIDLKIQSYLDGVPLEDIVS